MAYQTFFAHSFNECEVAGISKAGMPPADRNRLIRLCCDGYSPFREFLLGGAMRKILAEARLPVLMPY